MHLITGDLVPARGGLSLAPVTPSTGNICRYLYSLEICATLSRQQHPSTIAARTSSRPEGSKETPLAGSPRQARYGEQTALPFIVPFGRKQIMARKPASHRLFGQRRPLIALTHAYVFFVPLKRGASLCHVAQEGLKMSHLTVLYSLISRFIPRWLDVGEGHGCGVFRFFSSFRYGVIFVLVMMEIAKTGAGKGSDIAFQEYCGKQSASRGERCKP